MPIKHKEVEVPFERFGRVRLIKEHDGRHAIVRDRTLNGITLTGELHHIDGSEKSYFLVNPLDSDRRRNLLYEDLERLEVGFSYSMEGI